MPTPSSRQKWNMTSSTMTLFPGAVRTYSIIVGFCIDDPDVAEPVVAAGNIETRADIIKIKSNARRWYVGAANCAIAFREILHRTRMNSTADIEDNTACLTVGISL